MNRKLEMLIPLAIEAIKKNLVNKDNGTVASEYNGYIASFGASVIQNGILAAISFYSNKNSDSNKERWKLLNAISDVLKIPDEKGEEKKEEVKCRKLFEYACTGGLRAKGNILDAATALKLSIRTFELKKNGE